MDIRSCLERHGRQRYHSGRLSQSGAVECTWVRSPSVPACPSLRRKYALAAHGCMFMRTTCVRMQAPRQKAKGLLDMGCSMLFASPAPRKISCVITHPWRRTFRCRIMSLSGVALAPTPAYACTTALRRDQFCPSTRCSLASSTEICGEATRGSSRLRTTR